MEETTHHLFFGCLYAQTIWRASGIPNINGMNQNTSLEEIFEVLLSTNPAVISTHFQHLVVWIFWRIWKSRNLLIFQRRNQSWKSVLSLAKNDMNEWTTTEDFLSLRRGVQDRNNCNVTNRSQHWQKPPHMQL